MSAPRPSSVPDPCYWQPVRPVERSELEEHIENVVHKALEEMHDDLREDQRVEEDVTMNETEKLRLALKYKYKYKYKYEVKKHQDRSTPLLGDSWDLDPAITQGGQGTGFDDSVSIVQDTSMDPEETEQEAPVVDIKIPADEFTLNTLVATARTVKQELDRVWAMMGPPDGASSLSQKELREVMRQQRQDLLPREKAIKKLHVHLKTLIQVVKDCQSEESTNDDGVNNLDTENEDVKVARGNRRVQKALEEENIVMVTQDTLTHQKGEEPFVIRLRHALKLPTDPESVKCKCMDSKGRLKSDNGEAADGPEGPGWNKSVFLDKEGKYPAAHTSGKPCGFREFRADPWYRQRARYG